MDDFLATLRLPGRTRLTRAFICDISDQDIFRKLVRKEFLGPAAGEFAIVINFL